MEKKMGKYIGIRMGIAMSVTMSFVGSLMGAMNAAKQSGAPLVPVWIPSFLSSLVITIIVALLIGMLVPMKKVNDRIAQATKAKGFVLHLLQSLASDLIYTPIISSVMAFFSTAVFVIPKNPELNMHMLVPVAFGSFAKSIPIEFIIALIVIMIIEPMIRKSAVKKFVSNMGQAA